MLRLKMKNSIIYILMLSFISQVALGQSDIPLQFCGEEYPERELVSNWRKTDGKFCAKAACRNGESTLERQRCIYQREYPNTILMSQHDDFRSKDVAQYKSREDDFILNEGDTCFEECKPVPKTLLGFKQKDIFGVARESCRICFANRNDINGDGSYINPVTQKRIFQDQKCHFPCKGEKGDFGKRTVSAECKACSGEYFQFIQTKSSNCYEVDEVGGKRLVTPQLCKKDPDLSLTQYKQSSSFSFASLIFGAKPDCFEVDEKSEGTLLKFEVDRKKCESANEVVDSERSSGKNVDSAIENKKTTTGKTTQQ